MPGKAPIPPPDEAGFGRWFVKNTLLSRRACISGAVGAACIPPNAKYLPILEKGGSGLRHRVISTLGVAIENEALQSLQSRELIARRFTGITCQSAMKSRVIFAQRGKYNFKPARLAVEFASHYKMKLRGHTLLWHLAMPSWLVELVERGEASASIEKYIYDVARQFRGNITAWDVVNEPISDSRSGSALKSTILTRKLGEDIIRRAFSISHHADPHSRKYINDFFFLLSDERCRNKMKNLLRYATYLRTKDTPIHGLGLQGHLNAGSLLPFKERVCFFREIKDLGLQISITELDVRDLKRRSSVDERDGIVADTVNDLLDSIGEAGVVCPVYTWGLSDRFHARVKTDVYEAGLQRPTPFDDRYRPKDFMRALEQRVR